MSLDPFSSELFPELRVPASAAVPRTRSRAPKVAAPAATTPAPPASAATLPVAAASTPVPAAAPATPATTDAPPSELEALAERLAAHPDYRVLRRLQPQLLWPTTEARHTLQVLVLDTETTGLDHARDRIIELAMLRFAWNPATGLPEGPVQVFDELEDPGFPIPDDARRITGIQDADVAGKRIDDARVASFLAGVDLVIAHNAGFDRPFAERRFPAFAALAWGCSFADLDWKLLEEGSAKLESLALSLGLFYDAHRAETDCHALLRVLLAPRPQADGDNGLSLLVRQSQGPSYRLQATGAPFDAKDALKARNYRWNADQKVWGTTLASAEALAQECRWLRDSVYRSRAATVRVEEMDARVKYSQRSGRERFVALANLEG